MRSASVAESVCTQRARGPTVCCGRGVAACGVRRARGLARSRGVAARPPHVSPRGPRGGARRRRCGCEAVSVFASVCVCVSVCVWMCVPRPHIV